MSIHHRAPRKGAIMLLLMLAAAIAGCHYIASEAMQFVSAPGYDSHSRSTKSKVPRQFFGSDPSGGGSEPQQPQKWRPNEFVNQYNRYIGAPSPAPTYGVVSLRKTEDTVGDAAGGLTGLAIGGAGAGVLAIIFALFSSSPFLCFFFLPALAYGGYSVYSGSVDLASIMGDNAGGNVFLQGGLVVMALVAACGMFALNWAVALGLVGMAGLAAFYIGLKPAEEVVPDRVG